MQTLRARLAQPRAVYSVLVPLLVALWFLAGVGGDRTPSDGGLYYVGAAAWLLFGITFVVTIAYSLAQLVRLVRRSAAS